MPSYPLPAQGRRCASRLVSHEGGKMRHLTDFVARLYAQLDDLEWVARLMVRIAVGLEFFGSGLGKLGKLNGLIQYFRSLGMPAADILAPFVASMELVCGLLVAIGLLTRPAAAMLCGVMTVAT